jgi:hypothetical protein
MVAHLFSFYTDFEISEYLPKNSNFGQVERKYPAPFNIEKVVEILTALPPANVYRVFSVFCVCIFFRFHFHFLKSARTYQQVTNNGVNYLLMLTGVYFLTTFCPLWLFLAAVSYCIWFHIE